MTFYLPTPRGPAALRHLADGPAAGGAHGVPAGAGAIII